MSSRDAVLALYRTQFPAFVRFAHRELYPHVPLIDTWHIDVVADHLQRVAAGEITRLIINLPPRSLKSVSASIALPVLMLGRNPRLKIMSIAGSRELAGGFAMAVRELIATPRCRAVFPHLKPRTAAGDLQLEHGGRLISGIVGRTLVGRGADLIIIDDPIAPAYVHDAQRRTLVNTWFDAEVIQRLDDKAKGAVVVVMQRLHHDDLCGHLLGGEQPWVHLKLPAVATEPECWTLSNGVQHTRQTSDVIAPRIDSREQLLARMMDIGAYNFGAQYQQAPFEHMNKDEMRGGCFAGPDDINGFAGRWFGRVSERAIMAHEVFGIGDRHPAERPRQMSLEELERVMEVMRRRRRDEEEA